MRTHGKIKEQLIDFVLGELSQQQAEAVRDHAAGCSDCRDEIQRLKALFDCTEKLKHVAADENLCASADQRILTLTADEKQKPKTFRPSFVLKLPKGTIAKNKIIQVASAVMIVIAVGICIHNFGGSVDISTIAFADVSEAMRNVPWMHTESRGFQENMPTELWVGFESNSIVSQDTKGKVVFLDFKNHKVCEYNPEKRQILINYLSEKDAHFPSALFSPNAYLDSMLRYFKEKGIEMAVKETQYNGQKAFLREISDEKSYYRLYIQPKTNLLLSMQMKTADGQGNGCREMETTFSYPEKGPESIYDLKIPKDTTIIDQFPTEEFLVVWKAYEQCRDYATDKYIAVITHESPMFGINTVDVDCKSDTRYRFDRHFVLQEGELIKPGINIQTQPGDSLESLLAWTQEHYHKTGFISVDLYDGQYYISTRRDDKNRWTNYRKIPGAFSVDMMPNNGLASLAWPRICSDGRVKQDDEYAKEHSLICIERRQQGSVNFNIVSHPARFLYYLDPEKNYICLRTVVEWRPDAEWQRDKDWLKSMDSKNIPDGDIIVQDITEMVQATNGYWYPKMIEERQTGLRKDYRKAPLRIVTIKRVYLQTNPEFPDGNFNFELPEMATETDSQK